MAFLRDVRSWAVAGAIGAVVLTSSACGASYQTVAEGDGEFNRCMHLDRDETVANEDRSRCWNAWQGTYVNAQSPERIQFARGRVAELNGNQRGPSSGGAGPQQGGPPGYGPQQPQGAPPGWGQQPPPQQQGGYGSPAYAQDPNAPRAPQYQPGPQGQPPAPVVQPVQAQAPAPVPQPAAPAGGPPGSSCATTCQGAWNACGGACENGQAACVARCDDAYRDCMRGCY